MNALVTGDDLVTGEAVALELPAATVGLRAASGLIDVVIELVLLIALLMVSFTAVSTSDEAVAAVAVLLCTVGVLVGLPTALETLTRGKTIGKLALGLRAVRDDAGPITFRQSLVRSLVGFVEIWIFYGVPALLCALVNSRGKRLGDMVAGTYVVRERFSFPPMRPVMMPPHLAHWAATADIAPLPETLALATRQFLMRTTSLDPPSRARLGSQLCAQVLGYVAPQPPAGQHPENVLAAVLAERRRRDEARLAREAQLRARLRRTP
jgi:uncharacterized RDD family membrane protein YckC